ncbi:putative peptidoglycan biosynthesis protein MurJ [Streptomyces rubrolavendulae]|uniref:Putative peptidoglycan biosynthesis protein MurJ n=2 Tax=Streptomyces TaxID=1883 RepID=A0A1D8G441_9ACTN|nr:putative peptidoglycan biosynthesis protein MurJ [Streptomyces rubrolavendulae]
MSRGAAAPVERPRPAGGAWAPSNRFLARAALLTGAFTAVGALLGLLRDQLLAHTFGAGPDTDAFLVAWTVPEFASTLLIEDAMALVLVPAFSRALAARADAGAGGHDPVRDLVRTTLPRTAAVTAAVAALVAAAAPLLVPLLAPGLPEQRLAVDCTRLTATCVLSFALAGYFSAALRAHGRYLAPAAIYVAYNTGIITAVVLFGPAGGVRAAAAGVAAGGALMALIQAPDLVRRLRRRSPGTAAERGAGGRGGGPAAARRTAADRGPTEPATAGGGAGDRGPAAGLRAGRGAAGGDVAVPAAGGRAAEGGDAPAPPAGSGGGGAGSAGLVTALVAPVVLFAVGRQSQVLVERFLAAPLPAGAISHLNYAQKVAQLPMVLSLMLCTVSFPVIARALAAGDREAARRRAERDLLLAGVVVLVGAATVAAAAPQIVGLLFQRGAFDAADTAATASVMRVYALGLLGHAMVSALGRCYFSESRPLWFPAAAMALGVAVNAALGALWADRWGTAGIALANAAGITLTAALLLAGTGRRRVPLSAPAVAGGLARLAAAAALATAAGRLCAPWAAHPLLGTALAAAAVLAVFVTAAHVLRAPLVPHLTRVALTAARRPLPRRHRHAPTHPAAPLDRDVPLRRHRQG